MAAKYPLDGLLALQDQALQQALQTWAAARDAALAADLALRQAQGLSREQLRVMQQTIALDRSQWEHGSLRVVDLQQHTHAATVAREKCASLADDERRCQAELVRAELQANGARAALLALEGRAAGLQSHRNRWQAQQRKRADSLEEEAELEVFTTRLVQNS